MKQSAQGHAAGEQQSWDLNTGILSPKIVVVITTQASGCLPVSCSLINRNLPSWLKGRSHRWWGAMWAGVVKEIFLEVGAGEMGVRRCSRAGVAGRSAGEERHTALKSGHLGQAPLALRALFPLL